jgi:hypothetical protein
MPRSMLSRASTENLTSLAAMLMCFIGACTLAGFTVITDEIAAQTWALRRLFHSPG